MVRSLKLFYRHREQHGHVWEAVKERLESWVPEEAEALKRKASQAKRAKPKCTRAQIRQKKADAAKECWEKCKKRRKPMTASPDVQARKRYRAEVLADQRRGMVAFYPDTPRRARASGHDLEAMVDNASPLPAAVSSDIAMGLQRWCQRGAWAMCSACHLLQPRALTEKDLNLDIAPVPEIPKSACRRCRAKHQRLVPQPEDVPMPFRDLSTDILHALRPLDIDVGPEVRASGGGYRKKVRMITFSWSLQSVDDKIHGLKTGTLRRQARKALKYLLENQVDNEYHDYYDRHNAFLARYPEPTAQQARRPLHFIEDCGLETALWPHLYWQTSMCESFERLNARRLTCSSCKPRSSGNRRRKRPAQA